jgi:hypothetical protein
VSQEQLKPIEQQGPDAEDEVKASSSQEEGPVADAATPNTEDTTTTTTSTLPKKKRVKKALLVDEKAISPHPSYWPLALAFSLAVLLLGAVTNLIILGVGVLLIIVSIIGWITERR